MTLLGISKMHSSSCFIYFHTGLALCALLHGCEPWDQGAQVQGISQGGFPRGSVVRSVLRSGDLCTVPVFLGCASDFLSFPAPLLRPSCDTSIKTHWLEEGTDISIWEVLSRTRQEGGWPDSRKNCVSLQVAAWSTGDLGDA